MLKTDISSVIWVKNEVLKFFKEKYAVKMKILWIWMLLENSIEIG